MGRRSSPVNAEEPEELANRIMSFGKDQRALLADRTVNDLGRLVQKVLPIGQVTGWLP